MVEFSDLTVTNAGKLSFKGEAKRAEVNPIRFVGACAKGHLQDINWRFIAHRNADRSCRKPLFWVERGVSSDPSDISVRCTCDATVTLADLYKPKFLGRCECHSPWLTPRRIADEACADDLKLLPRSATNTYFLSTRHGGDLADEAGRPSASDDRGAQDDDREHPFLAKLLGGPACNSANEGDFQGLLGRRDHARARQGWHRSGAGERQSAYSRVRFDDERRAFYRRRYGWLLLLYAEDSRKSGGAGLGLEAPWDAFLKNVVKVHRLREVTCLYGFTRLEPPPTSADSELDEIQLAIGGADLARTVEWLPAIERFGEGIFLHVAPEFVKRWLGSPEITQKAASFRDRERRDAERFNRPPIHFGAAYWALHSLSHAFMAELALECGYPLSSLKERIYSSGPAQPDRFGILTYTSTAGGQGTLGGLSGMAERVGELLVRATKRCSPSARTTPYAPNMATGMKTIRCKAQRATRACWSPRHLASREIRDWIEGC